MKFHVACCLLIMLDFSCNNSTGLTKLTESKVEIKHPVNKPPSSFSDTIKINSPAAVFYSPDSLQLKNIKSITDAGVFEGSMHEYYYLRRNAHSVIRKYFPQLKIIEAKNVRFLLLIDQYQRKNFIDLDLQQDAYGLFVFDGKKPPRLVDMANIESELGFYFSR